MALFTPTAYWGGGSPQPFDPSDLGIWSWLSMNNGSIGSNSTINSITDIGSGGTFWYVGGSAGNQYAQRSTTSGITYNGSNAVYAAFDGTGDYWRTNNYATITDSSGNSYIVMLCYVYNSDQKNDSIISLDGSSVDFQISSDNGGTWSGQFDMNGLSSTSILSWYSDNGTTRNYTFQWNIFAFVFNKTGNQIYGRINGYPLSNTVTYSSAMTAGYVRLPVNRLGSRRLRMDMAEMLIVRDKPGTSSNTSIENLEKVEGWLAWTYGTEGRLNPSHPYANAAPRTAP